MSPEPERPTPLDLPRLLGPWSAASIVIGCVIGSGVFMKPAEVAAALPSPGWILVTWVASGLLALIGSLAFAEMSSKYPEAGGQYVFIRESFGRLPAFLYGWTNIIIINSASVAAIAFISVEFLVRSLQHGGWLLDVREGDAVYKLATVGLILVLTTTNAVGVLWGARLQNFLTAAKLLVIGAIIAGIFLPGRAHLENLRPFWSFQAQPGSVDVLHGFGTAFLAIFWAYDGWYLLGFSGAEIREPRRNIPIGFTLGILVVVAAYALVNLAYMAVMPLGEQAVVTAVGGVGAEAARRLFGEDGLLLISLGVFGSALGAANGQILTGPRLCFAMARDRLFFRPLAEVHPRFLTPFNAVVVQGLLAVLCVFAGNFDDLTDSVVFAAWIFYGLAVVGLFILRRKEPAGNPSFRMPGYPVLPFLFAVFAACFVAYSARDSALTVIGAFDAWAEKGRLEASDMTGAYPLLCAAVILAGIPVYLFFSRRSRPVERPGAPPSS